MASGIYNVWKEDLMKGDVDMVNDTIKVGLLDDSHSFTDSDSVWGDISANEVSGTGYTAGGATLASKSVTKAAATKFDAADVEWTSATFDADFAVIYDTTNTSSLIACIDFGGTLSVVSGTLTIEWNAAGIITLT